MTTRSRTAPGGLALAGALCTGLLASQVASAAPRGALKQLKGKAGCHALAPGFRIPRKLCTRARIKYLKDAGLAPGGRHLYTANSRLTAQTGSVSVFVRNRRTGELRQLAGEAGCLANAARLDFLRGCGTARVGRARGLAVSPDGRHVYVGTGDGPGELAIFSRDPRSGVLTQAPGPEGCVGGAECTPGHALAGIDAVQVTADGRNVYVLSEGQAVGAFARDPVSGALTPLGRPVGGMSPSDLALSRDGRHVYVSDSGEDPRVVVLARSPADGTLLLLGAARPRGGAELGLFYMTVSPDGGNVYVSGMSNAYVFRRDRGSGALRQLAGRAGCLGARGCDPGRAVDLAEIAISRDGRSAYSVDIDGVGVYSRRSGGRLRLLRGRQGCLSFNGSKDHFERRGRDCLVSRTLINPFNVDVSPDGRHVYASGTLSQSGGVQSQISIFSRATR